MKYLKLILCVVLGVLLGSWSSSWLLHSWLLGFFILGFFILLFILTSWLLSCISSILHSFLPSLFLYFLPSSFLASWLLHSLIHSRFISSIHLDFFILQFLASSILHSWLLQFFIHFFYSSLILDFLTSSFILGFLASSFLLFILTSWLHSWLDFILALPPLLDLPPLFTSLLDFTSDFTSIFNLLILHSLQYLLILHSLHNYFFTYTHLLLLLHLYSPSTHSSPILTFHTFTPSSYLFTSRIILILSNINPYLYIYYSIEDYLFQFPILLNTY